MKRGKVLLGFGLLVGLVPFQIEADSDSGTLLLYNDSPFILTAVIQAADGSFLGQISVQPSQQTDFTTNFPPTAYQHAPNPNVSFTPYTVIWQCPSKEYYSMCTQVSPGAFVSATDCPGPHFCPMKPKSEEPTPPASTLEKKK